MTIRQAREILGKSAKDCSDQDIARDIETALLLKDIFFTSLNIFQNDCEIVKQSKKCHNMAVYEKESDNLH